MENIVLSNKVTMPQEGYGVFQISNEETERCVSDALACGYRLIDTAAAYMNEEGVGEAIKKSGIAREELFITTKLWVQDAGYENAKKAIETSLEKLGLDYIDLYLVHQPFGDYYGSWRAMEEAYDAGILKAVGVCNFDEARLTDLCENVRIKPMVNQVEIHPFFQQNSLIDVMKEYGVASQAWGPLSEGQKDIFNNELLKKIGDKYGKTVAQVILRWHVQRGVIIIPKSSKKTRMEENMNIWDFELGSDDMEKIASMDIGHSEIINHHTAGTARMLNQWKIHE